MKQAAALLLLLLLLTACQAQPGSDSSFVPPTTSVAASSEVESAPAASLPDSSLPEQTEEDANPLTDGNLTAEVSTDGSIEIQDASLHYGVFSFTYSANGLQGQAAIQPSFCREYATFDDVKSLSVHFEQQDGIARLIADWQLNDVEQQDIFILEEVSNLWVYQWEGIELYPLLIDEQQAERLFPDEEIVNYTLATLACFEPMYDVSIYLVGDQPGLYEPNNLLAYYEVYEPSASFFWQTDFMYKNHLTVQYTNGQGEQTIFAYNINRILHSDSTMVELLDEPDWPV